MLTFVSFVWPGERGYGAVHANMLASMLERTTSGPWRLVIIADPGIEGFDSRIELVRTPPAALELADLRTPEGPRFPSSYRRLWLFSAEAAALGDRLLLTDVDVVVTGDLAPLAAIDADFVGWRPGQSWGNTEVRLAGGMWLLRAGSMTWVWEEFDGATSIAAARAAGFRGSDQAYLSRKLAHRVPVWPPGSGIYSIRDMTRDDRSKRTTAPPDDARVVHFNGRGKPWDERIRVQHPWVADFWC